MYSGQTLLIRNLLTKYKLTNNLRVETIDNF